MNSKNNSLEDFKKYIINRVNRGELGKENADKILAKLQLPDDGQPPQAGHVELVFHAEWKLKSINDSEFSSANIPAKSVRILLMPNVIKESVKIYLSKFNLSKDVDSFNIIKSTEFTADSQYELVKDYIERCFAAIQSLLKKGVDGGCKVQIVSLLQPLASSDPFIYSLYTGINTALSALLKTAEKENPQLVGQLIESDSEVDLSTMLNEVSNDVLCAEKRIRYQNGKRWVQRLVELDPWINSSAQWNSNGIYLITGGLGGIGVNIARDILGFSATTKVILVGRTPSQTAKQLPDYIALCQRFGGQRVEYLATDISVEAQVNSLFERILSEDGQLNGIIHGAGLINDQFIRQKKIAELENVLSPKINGTLKLLKGIDTVFSRHRKSVDDFIMCSSCSGQLGFVGQGDYAAANGFMDGVAQTYRGDSIHRILSINWPLWKSGGMTMDSDNEQLLHEEYGLIPLPTEIALKQLHSALGAQHPQVLIAYGDRKKIMDDYIGAQQDVPVKPESTSVKSSNTEFIGLNDETIRARLLVKLKEIVGNVIKHEPSLLDAEQSFEHYGIESFAIVRINARLAEVYGNLSKTILYEVDNLSKLAELLIKDHPEKTWKWLAVGENNPKVSLPKKSVPGTDNPVNLRSAIAPNADEIAIIGFTGRFPKASTLSEFWENLTEGRDCVEPVPEDRWNMEKLYEQDKSLAAKSGKIYCQYGGFLENIYNFDSLFFKISPREALAMDPQERLFIECCWQALEDAGYTKAKISERHQKQVGVFAGITKTGFNLHGPQLWKNSNYLIPSTSFSSIANRVSFLLDLHGPSMPIDTMCSSSLVAIHEACKSIRLGECSLAIVGGVNLYLHPSNYIQLCASQMLSPTGRCHSFGATADGFVPGEGVAAMILKPLHQAQKDNDLIYATIKSSAVNHGGKAQGYTVPNPVSQSELIQQTMRQANVKAHEISYIEAHGTGTELGDPIEINALSKAFFEDTPNKQFCAIGSVKSNIGHLEAAAGMAGIAKVLMQMRYKKLVPSIHVDEINPNIYFEDSPFYIQKSLTDWKPVNSRWIAGISSFGAAGVNAHVILEAYPEEQDLTATQAFSKKQGTLMFPVSANTRDGVIRYCEKLIEYLNALMTISINQQQFTREHALAELRTVLENTLDGDLTSVKADDNFLDYGLDPYAFFKLFSAINSRFNMELDINDWNGKISLNELAVVVEHFHADKMSNGSDENISVNANLESIAYTLQTGRHAHKERVIIISDSADSLLAQLEQIVIGETDIDNVYIGSALQNKESLVLEHNTLKSDFEHWIQTGQHAQLATHWIRGSWEQWQSLYKERKIKPRLCRLPAYEFENISHNLFDETPVDQETFSNQNNAIKETRPMHSKPQNHTATLLFDIQGFIRREMSTVLRIKPDSIENDVAFVDYGLDSILGVELIHAINHHYGIKLKTTSIYDYGNINDMSNFIVQNHYDDIAAKVTPDTRVNQGSEKSVSDKQEPVSNIALIHTRDESIQAAKSPIAVIGMSGRFGPARNLEDLWEYVVSGSNLVEPVSRWELAEYFKEDTITSDVCQRGGFLKDIDCFDPAFFNITGIEATYMDPQQRLFLEAAWHALEDAGYAGVRLSQKAKNSCGVYTGNWVGDYTETFADNEAPGSALWGTMGSIVAARITYFLDLKGPAITVDTSCSSSLVALHLACKDLRNRDTDMALAGGVFIQSTPRLYVQATRAGMLSPTGTCSPFDDSANGFVPGEGVGVVVLKRLDDALRDGDPIHGVIHADGVNQDGHTNGITAPSALSQENLLTETYQRFGINPADISLVEAHGTGTNLGDPIEFTALKNAFESSTQNKQYCALGSVKANIGHAQFAAGIAGVIKVLLAMKYRTIPPLANYKKQNKEIDLIDSPFYAPTRNMHWDSVNGKRLATVSAFGVNGTNAHVVIGDAPEILRERNDSNSTASRNLFTLSARSNEQLREYVNNLVAYLEKRRAAIHLDDVCYTLGVGRKHHSERLACVATNTDDLIKKLSAWLAGHIQPLCCDTQGWDAGKLEINGSAKNTVIDVANGLEQRNRARLEQQLLQIAEQYLSGASLDFESVYQQGRTIFLPTYPFKRTRYWTKSAVSSKEQKNAPRKNEEIVSIVRKSTVNKLTEKDELTDQKRFEFILNPDDFFIEEHVVKNQTILPAVMYLEMINASVRKMDSGADFESGNLLHVVNDLIWLQPMIFEGEPLKAVVEISQKAKGLECKVYSQGLNNKGESSLHAQAYVSIIERITAQEKYLKAGGFSIEKLQHMDPLSIGTLHNYLEDKGICHGDNLRAISEIYTSSREVIGKLELPALFNGDTRPFIAHPSLLDSAIQVSSAIPCQIEMNNATNITRAGHVDRSGETKIPFTLNRYIQFGPLSPTLWCHGTKIEQDGKEVWLLALYDSDKRLCAVIDGYTHRAIRKPTVENAHNLFAHALWLPVTEINQYRHSVSPVFILHAEADRTILEKGNYRNCPKVVLNTGDSVDSIAAKLKGYVQNTEFVWLGSSTSRERTNMDLALVADQENSTIACFRFIKALLKLGLDAKRLTLTVATNNAIAVNPNEPVNPRDAGVHGLIGSIAKEYSHWQIGIYDLDSQSLVSLKWLQQRPTGEFKGETLCYRSGQWYHQRIVRVEDAEFDKSSYRRQGVYLVIGGAGGLGRVWSEHLIKNYDARVIWIGRRPIDDEIQWAMREVEKLSAHKSGSVEYYSVDAADPQAMIDLSQKIKRKYGQLNGIVHSAIVLADNSFAAMQEQTFRSALTAKVDTSVNIARAFGVEPLDFVLFFSSLQSFARQPGQSNYAAGCTFKDAFADLLRDRMPGVKVKTVNWGYWGSIGIASGEHYENEMNKSGLVSIQPEEAMVALDVLLNGGLDQALFIRTQNNEKISLFKNDLVISCNESEGCWLPEFEKQFAIN